MKYLILSFAVLIQPAFAQDAANEVDPAIKGAIARGCEHQMSRLSPDHLKDVHVSPASFCGCVATRHVRHAERDLLPEDFAAYLNKIVAFYATRTAAESAPLRKRDFAANDDDFNIAELCNRK